MIFSERRFKWDLWLSAVSSYTKGDDGEVNGDAPEESLESLKNFFSNNSVDEEGKIKGEQLIF